MNIFLYHTNMYESAQRLDNKKLGKQIIECNQMVAVYCHKNKIQPPVRNDGEPYGMSHPHHPVTRWVCQSLANVKFTIDYAIICGTVWKQRYGKRHGAATTALRMDIPEQPSPVHFIFVGAGEIFYGPLDQVVKKYCAYK